MRSILTLFVASLCTLLGTLPVFAAQATSFDQHFTGQTLRFDYFHSGTAEEEQVSSDGLRLEGDWPGSRKRLLDDTNLGKYFFEVRDQKSGQLLYSRGFASIYGEWETTGEAREGVRRTYHESQRFPEPRRPVLLTLAKRQDDGGFQPIFSMEADPSSRFVNRSPIVQQGAQEVLFASGPASSRVDLLFLGDGYSAKEIDKFQADVRRLSAELFAFEPFRSRKDDFNVRSLVVPAAASGVTDPRAGKWFETPLGLSYNAFDSERYMLTAANRSLREIAAQLPYDALILVANSEKYGGGGIYNLWTTLAADSGQSAYIVVHELGHSFAGLGDEYYTSQVSYESFIPQGVEPWEPNVTALLDPETLKWKKFVGAEVPLPTPWNQEHYDEVSLAYQERRQDLRSRGASESEMDVLFAEVKTETGALLGAEKYAGAVGAFEGSSYQAKGLYRPAVDCIMFTRNPDYFCPVCTHGIERVIDLYSE